MNVGFLIFVHNLFRKDTLPSFGKHHGYGVTKDFPLVGYILHDITGPPHQISNLVARRWPINIPFKIFFHLFSEEILLKKRQENWDGNMF